jgi:anti-sigma B factor antagonist
MKLDARGVVDLQISIRQSGDITILDLHGKATIGVGSDLLRSHFKQLVASGVRRLLLNLADLTQVDSSGISIVVKTCVSLRSEGGDLRLLHLGGRVREVFAVLHLLEMIPSFDDESQALASFRPLSHVAKTLKAP